MLCTVCYVRLCFCLCQVGFCFVLCKSVFCDWYRNVSCTVPIRSYIALVMSICSAKSGPVLSQVASFAVTRVTSELCTVWSQIVLHRFSFCARLACSVLGSPIVLDTGAVHVLRLCSVLLLPDLSDLLLSVPLDGRVLSVLPPAEGLVVLNICYKEYLDILEERRHVSSWTTTQGVQSQR